MNRRTHLALAGLIAGLALFAAACSSLELHLGDDRVEGSGRRVTETRDVSGFDRVVLDGLGAVVITTGGPDGVTIVTDDNLARHVDTSVKGSTLTISTPDDLDLDPSRDLLYRISVRDLRGIELRGVGSFEVVAPTAHTFDVVMSGVGDVDLTDLFADQLVVDMSGVGSLSVSGEVGHQIVRKSGVGSYQAGDLKSRISSIDSDGPGSARLWVTDDLEISAGGVGSIQYYGSPKLSGFSRGLVAVESLGPR